AGHYTYGLHRRPRLIGNISTPVDWKENQRGRPQMIRNRINRASRVNPSEIKRDFIPVDWEYINGTSPGGLRI
ncbi:MAG: hypothetical protein K9I74_13565, partial [Bacteroidales bacterium]|nr:hypothetical protein [Bacteroidales bacterium]